MKDLQNQKEMREADAAAHETAAHAHADEGNHLMAAHEMEKAAAAHSIAGNSDASRKASDSAFALRRYGKMAGQDRRAGNGY